MEAHEAAPRWHFHGDYKCVSDSSVSVQVFEQGRQHLQAIAQMQSTLVRQQLLLIALADQPCSNVLRPRVKALDLASRAP